MEIIQIVGLGIIASILSIIIKSQRPEIAMQISLAAGIIIFTLVSVNLSTMINLFTSLAGKVNLDIGYISTIIKIIGIAYIAEFGAEICRDVGEKAIASKIEFAGKILILVMAVPIILALLNLIIDIFP